MANPRIIVDVIMDALKLKRGADESEKAVSKLDKVLEKLGKGKEKTFDALSASAKDLAKDKLGPLGTVADKAGVDLDEMKGKTLAAGAAVAALGVFVAGGIVKLKEMTAEVRQYKDAAKLGWEEASRFAAVFKDFGISADDGIDALKTLAEEAGDAPEKFERFKVEMVKTSDGSIDLSETLKNTAERFKEIKDPTERAAMGAALFGDNWLRIAPVLEKGADGLGELIDNVDESRIVTEEAAREQQMMDQSMRNLGTAVDELQMSMAQGLVPALSQTARGVSRVIEDLNRMGDRVGWLDGLLSSSAGKEIDQFNEFLRLGGKIEAGSLAIAKAKEKMGVASSAAADEEMDLAEAQEQAAHKLRILEANTKDAAAAAKELTKQAQAQTAALKDNVDTVLSVNGAVLSYEQAQLAAADAADELTVKQQAVTDAINEFGSDAPEATKAQRDYEKATLDSLNAMDGAAHAAVNQAEQLAKAAGQTFTAEQKSIVYREALEKLKGTSNDPAFISGMDGMISRAGAAADQYSRAAREAWALEAAASAAALAAAGVGNVGTGGMASVTADNAERILSNQRLPSVDQQPQQVTLQIDKKVLGQVMLPTLRDLERQRR